MHTVRPLFAAFALTWILPICGALASAPAKARTPAPSEDTVFALRLGLGTELTAVVSLDVPVWERLSLGVVAGGGLVLIDGGACLAVPLVARLSYDVVAGLSNRIGPYLGGGLLHLSECDLGDGSYNGSHAALAAGVFYLHTFPSGFALGVELGWLKMAAPTVDSKTSDVDAFIHIGPVIGAAF